MTYPNTVAILREFPFLKNFGIEDRQVKVMRWDAALLNEESRPYSFAAGAIGPLPVNNRFFLLDVAGAVVAQVGKPYWFNLWNPKSWFAQYRSEDVGQTLNRIGEHAATVHYVLNITHCSGVKFYKLPRSFENAAQWLTHVNEVATEQMRSELKGI